MKRNHLNVDPDMMHHSGPATGTAAARTSSWCMYKRFVAFGQLLLLAATHSLWLGQTTFPAVPLVTLPSFLLGADRVVVLVLIGLLLWIAFRKEASWAAFAAVLMAWVILFLFNQHRFQPWAYQAALWNLAFLAFSPGVGRSWISMMTISIYFYSACGKLDYQFLHTVGQDFLAPFLGSPDERVTLLRLTLAAMFPISELLVAIGLVFSRTRRYAGFAAVGMHLALLMLLGPFGQSHSLGVIAWNALLALQAWYLFSSPASLPSRKDSAAEIPWYGVFRQGFTGRVPYFAHGCFLIALLMPIGERFGYWDHWLSWSLYSPHTSRLELEVHETRVDRLPRDLQPMVTDADGDRWYSVPLETWSLSNRGVPIYPQGRFQLGVALAIAKQKELGDGMRAKLRGIANRWTGEREEQWLMDEGQLRKATQSYWLLPKPN